MLIALARNGTEASERAQAANALCQLSAGSDANSQANRAAWGVDVTVGMCVDDL